MQATRGGLPILRWGDMAGTSARDTEDRESGGWWGQTGGFQPYQEVSDQ